MLDSERIPLPPGLPTHLCYNKEGYEALCLLLGVTNRERRQSLVNARSVKQLLKATGNTPARDVRTAERIRQSLLAVYSDPNARREMWLANLHHESAGNAEGTPFPSLEYAALSKYDDALLDLDPDPKRLADVAEFHVQEAASDDWRAPALAALPRLKQDFGDWSHIAPDRRLEVVAAAFAAATLIDDGRLLRWAADHEEDIAREYAFLGKLSDMDVGPTSSDEVGELPERLRDRSKALRDAANDLVEHAATAELFDVVSKTYHEVLELREPVLEMSTAAAISDLIDDFATLLDEKASAAPWLAEESQSLLATWRETYLTPSTIHPERVQADIDRAVTEFAANFLKVTTAQADADAAKIAVDNHETAIAAKAAPSRADRQQRLTLSQGLVTANEAVVYVMDELIAVLQPNPDTVPPTDESSAKESDDAKPKTAPKDPTKVQSPHSQNDLETPPETPSQPGVEEEDHAVEEREVLADRSETKVSEPTVERSQSKPKAESAGDLVAPSQDLATPLDLEVPDLDDAEYEPRISNITTPSPTQDAVWRAVGNGRLGLAYHIARADQASGGLLAQPSPELLAAVALGTALNGPDDELAAAFGQRVGLLGGLDLNDFERPTRDALNLLLLVATLRPALFASQHGASIPLLRRVELSGDLTPVYRLAVVVADHAEKLMTVHLDVVTLSAILDEGVWKDRIAAHAEAVAKWREGAAAASFLFAGAGAVWQHWLSPRGILGQLVSALTEGRSVDTRQVQKVVDVLNNRRAIHTLIEDTYRQDLGRHGERISGRALAQLESRLEVPRDLSRTWLRIMEARPGGSGFVETTVERLRSDIDNYGRPALDAITSLRQSRPPAPLMGALTCALHAVESLMNLFQRDSDACAETAVGPVQALSDDLLLVTALRINENGSIDDSLESAEALALLVDADSHATNLGEAFNARLGRSDLFGAHAICDRMAVEDDDGTDEARERLNRALSESRTNLQNHLHKLAEQLEQAFVIGEVSDDERAELAAAIGDVSHRLEDRERSLTAGDDVASIAGAVEPSFARGIAKVKEQLDEYLPRDDAREQTLVQEALQAGNLAILHEQLDCLKRGQPLRSPDADARSQLHSFLAVADHIDISLKGDVGPPHDALVEAAKRRQDILGLMFSALSPAQARRSAMLLERWFLMARQRSPDPELIAGFFGGLGFTLGVDDVEPRGDTAAVLRAEPLRARELCPTHAFGSDAEGRYDLVFNWDAPARERIVQAISTAAPNAHTVILHFGKLARADREWLRRWSIEHSTPFITVDETLVLYLASLPGGALKTLFESTLPFTSTEPFFTAPGLVPPEAFFGRESERRAIMDPYDSCFVYGGRQLGKTALLHSAQAAFHDPSARRLAQYFDLKYEDVGVAHDADHIWHVLWHAFIKLGIVDADTTMPRGRNSLVNATVKAVTSWTDEHEDGRILLLLDEADAFLASDLKEDFRVSTRLKGLMDETGRRFKVVLFGLHNVLRNTERANHPLAHFGEPICVGPLLGNGDLEQARALVREPLAAVGYSFETDNLITQILVWNNYYPSLIQLYGQALLRHLRQAPGREFPGAVTADDIQAVFTRDQFRDYIRDRFSLTLQLDQRYEVIAYAMAFDLQGTPDRLSHGLRNNRIFELAREYWPNGFDIPEREFGTLLQEMCGLGVLRQRPGDIGTARYVFRNPNVLRLLGDAETILDVLYKERVVPDIFEASAFRAQYEKAGSPRRGPLTYEQEALLKRGGRIAVLCGNRATNLADVDTFLDNRMEEGRLRHLTPTIDGNALARELNRLRPDRDTYVCLVGADDPWTLGWLDRAAEALGTAQRGRNLRVVFRADPDQLWRFVKELPDEYLDADHSLFDWVPAQPWNAAFLRRWCSDQGLQEANPKIEDLLYLTGGWPLLLQRYAASPETTWQDRADALERHIVENRDDLLDAVGLGSSAARLELAPLLAWKDSLSAAEVETYADLWVDEGHPPVRAEVLRQRLCWATQLGLVQDVNGSTVFNPLIARILPSGTQ